MLLPAVRRLAFNAQTRRVRWYAASTPSKAVAATRVAAAASPNGHGGEAAVACPPPPHRLPPARRKVVQTNEGVCAASRLRRPQPQGRSGEE